MSSTSTNLSGNGLHHVNVGGVQGRVRAGSPNPDEETGLLSPKSPGGLPGDNNRNATVLSTALLQIADVVGVGFLTLPTAVSKLGWIPGMTLLVLLCPVNIYAGILISNARNLVPGARNYVEMARNTTGSRGFTSSVACLYYSYMVLTLASYLLAISKVLSMVFWEVDLCRPTWGMISILCLLPLVQMRRLNASKSLLWGNSAMITVSVLLALVYMYLHMGEQNVKTELFASKLTWIDTCGAISSFTFAYLGVYIFLEMIEEMKEPKRFPETFLISGPTQLALYVSVAGVGYAYLGAGAHMMVVDAIPQDSLLHRISTLCLFFYLLVAYLVKSIILTRAVMTWIFNKRGSKKRSLGKIRLYWFVISLLIALLNFVLANAIPVFDNVVSILGSAQSSLLGYVLPSLFVIFARKKADVSTSPLEKIAFTGMLLFGMFIFFVGTTANLVTIQRSYTAGNTPFACYPD
mmetsp:Transcript_19225/g.31553  ORF Transcript_19225/g.31553 Transcript_19225/m.31553 type:complete len:464 (+) Transcript_19225:292-1683(+)|eukprot:CAMPEP_0203783354 /NCGR_PEP_ID=MMETSP0099_2-20121227/11630_1 /ASSEMBLY_ACC=CAM_ASM_000209 /TAXON_ID=96639 /ORGANISM=" , Strain NY0313808BC1" /LENGTH=463 /DNA_ID=CAMNT_0050685213 /DNA_START=209 /DNA_END=1600 /DNA_ORIENTATION=+